MAKIILQKLMRLYKIIIVKSATPLPYHNYGLFLQQHGLSMAPGFGFGRTENRVLQLLHKHFMWRHAHSI